MIFIGVDPGVSGGIAAIDHNGVALLHAKMPATGRDVLDLLQPYDQRKVKIGNPVDPGIAARAMIEKVNPGVFGRPGAKMGVVSAFTFGRSVERVLMALLASRIPFDEVLPVKWQTALSCRSGGDKNITKARAQQLFPQVNVTHAIADALLLAEFCRRMERAEHGKEEDSDEEKVVYEASLFGSHAGQVVIPKANAPRRRARAH